MEDLDKFDLQILDILQKDNQTSQRDIGDRIGLLQRRYSGGLNECVKIRLLRQIFL